MLDITEGGTKILNYNFKTTISPSDIMYIDVNLNCWIYRDKLKLKFRKDYSVSLRSRNETSMLIIKSMSIDTKIKFNDTATIIERK